MQAQTIIHVNVSMMRFNKETGANEPCIVVIRDGCEPVSAHEVIIRDREGVEVARLVNKPDQKLKTGAQAWVETNHHVELVGQHTLLGTCAPTPQSETPHKRARRRPTAFSQAR